MRLERIILENFRQYYGRQRLEFSKDPQRNVTVIHGINGAGKTSLFLAINWCLYGTKVEDVKIIENVGDLISKEVVSQAKPGEPVRASVEITFSHDGERYLVRRALPAKKGADGKLLLEADEFLIMRTRSDGQAERVSNPVGTMNSILPANVREYFLFDGEKIDNFAKPEAAAQVKQAIYLVLNLEILERARRHLENAAREYRKELKQISGGELRDLLEQDEQARADRERAEQHKKERLQEIDSARRKIEEINHKLRDSQNAKALQQQRDRVDRDLAQRRSELESTILEIRDLATASYFSLALPAVEQALALIDEKRARGELPGSIRQQFVQDLLNEKRCICGRPFAEHSDEHRRLHALLERSMPGVLEDDVSNTGAALRTFQERSERQNTTLKAAMERRTTLMDVIKNLEAEEDDVSRQLKGSPLEEISGLERQRQDFEADIGSHNMEIGSLTERIEEHTRKIAELEKKITKARKQEKKERLLSTKLDLAQRSADAIAEMYQAFADNMRAKIERKTENIFKQLIWKESHFQNIRLGPDFHLEVIDRYGLPARPELSAGERQVLSLSFIAAMASASEEEAPLVMDTPFGRLSSHHRNSISERLPEMASQLVLFVTDEELRDQARQNIEARIGAEYRLEFDPKSSCTEIVEVR